MTALPTRVYRVAVVSDGGPSPTLAASDVTDALRGELPEGVQLVGVHVQECDDEPDDTLVVGALTIDQRTMQATLHGRPLSLTRKEYLLLRVLASDPGRTFTKGALLRDVWGYSPGDNTRTLDAHACRLRKRLGGKSWIENEWGVGYRLRAPEEVTADAV